jgi:O-antigen ligase
VLSKGPASAIVFYATTLPCLLATLANWPRATWASLLRDPPAAAAIGLVVWSGLTLLWGQNDLGRAGQFAADTAATLAFLLAMLAAWNTQANRTQVAQTLVRAGTANAVFSIAKAFALAPLDPRLHGWGLTSHPILGALVMQTAYLTALARGLTGPGTAKGTGTSTGKRWPNLLAALAMAAFILMTESRGPILAAGAATLVLCAAGPWRWRALGALAALAAIWFALPSAVHEHSTQVLARRGTSHRLQIWEYALQLIGNRPLIGHGLAANLHINVGTAQQAEDITFPHDLYLSLLFYSGIIGFLIFAALVSMLALRLLRRWNHTDVPWLAALGIGTLLGGLTDLGQITKGPGTMWLILWVPVGLMLGWWRGRKEGSTSF